MTDLKGPSGVQYIHVRASSLPSYNDCPRRAAARLFRQQLLDEGYEIVGRGCSASAAMGHSLHSLMAKLFQRKMDGEVLNRSMLDEAFDSVCTEFDEELSKEEAIWDATTPHKETAYKQLRAMADALYPIADAVQPKLIEQGFGHLVSPLGNEAVPIWLTGHIDVLDTRDELHDHKTGAKFPSCEAQLGGYAILAKLSDINVSSVRVNYVPRKGVTKLAEVRAESVRLAIDECKKAAWSTLKEFQRHYMDYLESGGDPWSFPANPASMTCTPKWCPAHKTGFCTIGK